MPASARKAAIEMTSYPSGAATARAFRHPAFVRLALVAILGISATFAHAADDLLVLKLVARDGKFEPLTLEVPAGKRFKIEISNEGKGPMEFESRDLKQERVLAAGAKSSVVINPLKPGTYTFFDEYHLDAPKGRIVAK
jgi:Cupredoxin-like domain